MQLPGEEGNQQWARRALAAAVLYFLLHFFLRLLVSTNVELDEAEQVLLTQRFAWGYGSQPPLYTWLQALLFSLLGPGVPALALMKNGLLLSLYLFTFLAARELAGEERPAVAAMASLLFIPQIAWESQRDLTHSVLATALAAATLYAAARLLRRGGVGDYLLFGLGAGLGFLGKYNFAIFLVALLAAGFSLAEFRRRLLSPRIFCALALFALLVVPHFAWVLTHADQALRQAGSLHRQEMPTLWLDYLRGSAALALAILSFLAPLALIYLLLFRRSALPGLFNPAPPLRLLGRTLLAAALTCLGVVLVSRVTGFKDRWMQPFLFAAAIYFPLRLRERLSGREFRRLLAAAAAVAALVLVLLPARTFLAARVEGRNQLNAPFDRLSERLRQAGFVDGNIVADNRWVGGNLRLRFQESSVFAPELPFPLPRPDAPWLFVWDATRQGEMPRALQQLTLNLPGCRADSRPQIFEAPSLHGDGTMRFGFFLCRAAGDISWHP